MHSHRRAAHGRAVALLAGLACLLSLALLSSSARAADSVLWGDHSAHGIAFAGLDGLGLGSLNLGGAPAELPAGGAIDTATGRIYFANDVAIGDGSISFANLDGSGGGVLDTRGATLHKPNGLALDPARRLVFWTNGGTAKISFARLDGTGGGDLNTTGATVTRFTTSIAVDRDRVFWTNADRDIISFANADGSGAGGTFNTGGAPVNAPFGIAIDAENGRLYWANLTSIAFANLDGSGDGGLVASSGATIKDPVGLAIDTERDRILWANYGSTAKVSFANLDDSGGGDLVTAASASNNAYPLLQLAPRRNGAPTISGGTTVGATLSCSTGSWKSDDAGAFLFRAPQRFSFQWRVGGSAITGATASTFTAARAGSYSCTVTARNNAGAGAQTSAAHTVRAAVAGPRTLGNPDPRPLH